MANGGKKIQKIKLYKCGYCKNNKKHILKKAKKEILDFPALVVYIKHEKYGNILFDTGYSEKVYKNGLISIIYNLVNKTYIKDNETIIRKLENDNIKNIEKIILSHGHPDHIGGLHLFKDYELITTQDTFDSMKKIKIKNLVFKNLIPNPNTYTLNILNKSKKHYFNKYFDEVYDIFEDESILGVKLNGHSKGQLGIFIPEYNLFFVADSAWGTYFSEQANKMKKIPQLIQNNFKEYCRTIECIQNLKKDHPEIKIIFSHEKFEEKIYE